MVNKDLRFEPDYAIPPGETLLDTIEYLGMTQTELAERTGRPLKTISEIINGKTAITPETALQLERVLGIPAAFWNSLQRNYDELLERKRERERLQQQTEWLKKIPVKELVKRGWIRGFEDLVDQLQEVLNYFGVASIEAWSNVWQNVIESPAVAYRKSEAYKSELGAVASWLRKGQIEAQKIICKPFNESSFKDALKSIRALTTTGPKTFVPEIQRLCAEVGVVVVFIPELPKCRISGATYWLSSDKAVIQLSLRYRTDDHLWFSFFHEAGHILLHGKRNLFLEYDNEESKQEEEEEANRFAANILIPAARFNHFVKRGSFNVFTIKQFAEELGIAPSIVVGRLQHEKIIPYRTRLNFFKKHFNGLCDYTLYSPAAVTYYQQD
ncbi:HigA family addiction module antitoxin [Neomoorella thermoacetica]|uniref:HigA family addiction module antitoxin n=1 Tax=Neomoorella thermoacetica TaxID=1525 RepID=UPI0030D13886